MKPWADAIGNLAACLPPAIRRWVLICDRDYQRAIARHMAQTLVAASRADDPACGLLEFLCCDGEPLRWGKNYRESLLRFSRWPAERVRICFDVTDGNFRELFAERPGAVRKRSETLRRGLTSFDRWTLTCGAGWRRAVIASTVWI